MMDLVTLDYRQIRRIMHELDRDLKQFETRLQIAQRRIDNKTIEQAVLMLEGEEGLEAKSAVPPSRVWAELDGVLGGGTLTLRSYTSSRPYRPLTRTSPATPTAVATAFRGAITPRT